MHTISRPHYTGLLRSTYKLQALRYTYKLQAPGRWAFVICMQIAGLSTLGFCDLLCRVSAPLLSAVAAWARSQSRRARATYLTLLGGRRDVCVLIRGWLCMAEGDVVIAGQEMCVVEAMKMQNVLRCPKDSTIKKVSLYVHACL